MVNGRLAELKKQEGTAGRRERQLPPYLKFASAHLPCCLQIWCYKCTIFWKSSALCVSHCIHFTWNASDLLSYLILHFESLRKDFRFVHANFICIKVDTSTSMQTLEFKAKNCSESFPNWQLLIGRFEISIFDWWYIKVSFL